MTGQQNSITIDNDIICVVQAGDQTHDTILAIVNVIGLLSQDLSEVKILVDYRHSGKINKSAYKAGFNAIKNTHFDKVAIFGASAYMSEMVNAMAHTVKKSHVIKFTKNRELALEWLNK